MRILVLNGPNINMLGIREPEIYGNSTYSELCKSIEAHAKLNNYDVDIFQSNHEGVLIDKIQESINNFDGIIINPAAYTHTSIGILDALNAVNIPVVEVHISDISSRESFRQISITGNAAQKIICGHGINGYLEAAEYLISK